MKQNEIWTDYHQTTSASSPSITAALALSLFNGQSGLMIDLGCGSGKDSLYYLSHGWQVLAIDLFPEFLINTRATLPIEAQNRLQIQKMAFENLSIPPADCINASYSLPFCAPGSFPTLWQTIQKSLRPGGIFAGTFWGIHDSWMEEFGGTRTFFAKEALCALFSELQTEHFEEIERDGNCYGEHGEILTKHWHEFHVVLRKPA